MKLYNTLTRRIEELKPLEDNKVKLYTCGLTVYNQPHIGNWLGYIYWDVLVRALKAEGYQVERTQNITDVGHLTSDDDSGEDKLEKGAKREGVTAWDIADKYIEIADQESKLLKLIPPDHLVRATAVIDEQIAFAQKLDAKGYLYKIDDDGMYFDTSKFPSYGELARLDIDGLEAGARVSVEGKRNITDFAVWKFSPKGHKRDMEWDSPWGVGFPGWHLECSVIAMETLGEQIDIHAGGIDHIPVHHINEIAQTEAITGKPFSQIWIHNNHLKADDQKMSKSIGNIYALQDVIDHGYDIDAFKLFAMQKHYRTEGNFTWDNLDAAQNRLDHWREAAAIIHQTDRLPKVSNDINGPELGVKMEEALADDLNTPKALHLIDDFTDKVLSSNTCDACLGQIIEIIQDKLGTSLYVEDISDEQKMQIDEREKARRVQDWAKSDEIRRQLAEQGIGLRDTDKGAIWYLFKPHK